ncbi:MAG TPA: hypothetical protein PKE64_06290 [Anaerolineae bacterium]|nr:hypothetical protein [Anaerolineae bacterium]HMR63607.1 hypothetical protein [Anaerolineae bacterium]
MEVSVLGHDILNRLSNLVWRLTPSPQLVTSAPIHDPIYEEIRRIERIVDDMATRPNRVVRPAETRDALSDPQRIIDLAG